MEKISFEKLDPKLRTLICEIGQEADHRHIEAYLVGGFVRDLILHRKNLDVDIVVGSSAVGFSRILSQKFRARLVVHERFKTASLVLPEGLRVDIATTRKEDYPFSGSLPLVRPGTIHDDLFRRDFTINAMAVRIGAGKFGELIDVFGGYRDLKEKKIRVLHKKSFEDDPTRLLRAIRFEQRFDFKMEEDTFRLLKVAFQKHFDRNVKPQRYFSEFKKILKESSPVKSLVRLNRLKGLNFISPSLKLDHFQKDCLIKAKGHIDWFEGNVPEKKLDSWFVYFIILVSNLSCSRLVNMASLFNLTKEQREDLGALDRILRYPVLLAKHVRPSEAYRLLFPLSQELILYLRVTATKKTIVQRIDRFLTCDSLLALATTGEDLKRIGFQSSQKLGDVLDLLLYHKIDGQIKNKRDELRLAQEFKERM